MRPEAGGRRGVNRPKPQKTTNAEPICDIGE